MKQLNLILNTIKSMSVYRNILLDPVTAAYLEHLKVLSDPARTMNPAETYSQVYFLLAQTTNPMSSADAWQNYLLDLILDDVNPFSAAAYGRGLDPGVFLEAVKRDLNLLQLAFNNGTEVILEATEKSLDRLTVFSRDFGALPRWTALSQQNDELTPLYKERLSVKEAFASAEKWDKLAERLSEYYSCYGCGVYGQQIAYKWENGAITAVSHPDPITFSGLIGYAETRREIIDNTLKFLKGAPSNNILLYGDRGTGKSSTIKALLNEFWRQGLRIVEAGKQQLADFPVIVNELSSRKHCFILFVDDLSFEENETGYKDFKALLEGSLEKRAENVLIYATSNRRHLVRETFADRESGTASQEVHGMDSVQEKLSLSDRFGITIIFPSPDQELFLEIVKGLAQQRNLQIEPQDLRHRALKWATWHNGRSPRSARQFIDHLAGELLLEKSRF